VIPIKAEETVLQGYWLDTGNSVATDSNWERIVRQTGEYLEFLASAGDGREQLYRDPADGRLWELTPVDPNLPAGPPLLQVIAPSRAEENYAVKTGR
jgi:hypothetical protein